MHNDTTPNEVEGEKTVPVPVQTNLELVYGDDDRFADDASFKETLRWDREGLR